MAIIISHLEDPKYKSGRSVDLLKHFKPGIAEYGELKYADAAFVGTGPTGRPVQIGVEVKQLSDVLKCIVDGRFSGHQLPGLLRSYYRVYLVIEGIYKADERSGVLMHRRGSGWREVRLGPRRFMASDLENWLLTHELKAGIAVRNCSNMRQVAQFIYTLYRWWDKGYDNHHSHEAIHVEGGSIAKSSRFRTLAAALPGIGVRRSAVVEKHFKIPRLMANATEEDWQEVDGIGKKTAVSLVKFWEGR